MGAPEALYCLILEIPAIHTAAALTSCWCLVVVEEAVVVAVGMRCCLAR